MISGVLAIVSLLSLVSSSLSAMAVPPPSALTPQRRSNFTVREPNVHAPDLYADHIDFVATLVDLPGASKKQSYWELSYQLFFIPEAKYYEALRQLPKGGSNPGPEQFHGRVLLAEGHRKKTRLGTLKDRTIFLNDVPFKQKVPDAQRTKFALLMTGYTVKIFDAALNTTVSRSGIFLAEPFEMNADGELAVARKTIYLNFMINPDGTLNRSQSARNSTDTTWK